MKRLLLVFGILVSGHVFAASSDMEPAAVVRLFLASFNAGNTDAAAATQTDDVAIVDEFAPFRWGGAGAFGRWLTALTAHDEAGGVTDGHMEMGDIVRTEVAGDAAYLVVRTVYSFKEKGVPMEAPAHMTFALRKEADGWRISAWTYSAPPATRGM